MVQMMSYLSRLYKMVRRRRWMMLILVALVCVFMYGLLKRPEWVGNSDGRLLRGDLYSSPSKILLIEEGYRIEKFSSTPGVKFARELGLSEANLFHPKSTANVWDLYPPQTSCPSLQRVGSVGDGGKWICDLKWLSSVPSCSVFSYGISGDSSFEEMLLRSTNCEIYAFDPTIGRMSNSRYYPAGDFYSPGGEFRADHLVNIIQPVSERRVHFEKIALSASSSGDDDPMDMSKKHLVQESLRDTMSRHGLQYLDLLKVDAEGAEWNSFHSLLEGCATSGEPVPVGQISVELHYQSLDKLENLFGLLQACGYLSVSREVNVNPCVNLGICHAAEYLFINPKRYYNADAIDVVAERQQAEVPPQPGAVIYILSHRKRLAQLCTALKLLYINFCVSYPRYPVIIFHDDFTDEDEIFVKNAVNSVRARRQPMMDLRIIRIKLDYPIKMSESRKTELKVLPKDHKCAATIGYRHMCHFHSFEAVEILRRQGFSHDYIMRLDDDSQITAPIGYDIFQMMHANGKKYGFAKIMSDDPLCVEGLWQEAEKFIEAAQTMRLPLLSKQQAAALRNTSTIESFYALMPSPFIFYNNFEIVHKSVWEHPLWLAWSDHIKASEGVYSKRWGDAPIHTIGVSMILAKKQIHRFKDLPYRHLPFIDQLPQGLPRPSADPFEIDTRCIFFDSWTCSNKTINEGKIDQVLPQASWMKQNQVESSKEKESTLHRLKRVSSALPIYEATLSNKLISDSIVLPESAEVQSLLELYNTEQKTHAEVKAKSVLYTFVFEGFEELLGRTIQSFYDNYAAKHKVPFVIFYTDKPSGFSVERSKKVLKGLSCDASVSYTAVPIHPLSEPTTSGSKEGGACVADSADGRSASAFMRHEAHKELISQHFQIFWRFSMDSALKKPLLYDVLGSMHQRGVSYGFHGVMRESSTCSDGAWELARAICAGVYKPGSPVPNVTDSSNVHCSGAIKNWDLSATFISNFEISSEKIWNNLAVKTFFDAVALHDKELGHIVWGDALVHTIAVLMALTDSEIAHMKDISYEAYGAFGYSDTDTHLENEPQPLHELHGYFSPQHFGWLGGDVAASFELPRYAGDSAAERQFLWLFGDTLIGTSSSKQRLEFAMISNSVAIATMRTGDSSLDSAPGQKWNPISSLKYYWSSDDAGKPISIFPMHSGTHHQSLTDSSKDKLIKSVYASSAIWPSSGATVGSSVVIVGKLSQDVSSSRKTLLQEVESTLAFKHVGSILIVIQNPLAPPDQWKMTTSLLPYVEAGNGEYLWHTLALASAAESNSKMAYLQGIHSKFGGGRSAFDIFAVVRRKYDSAVIGRIPTAALVSHDISQLEILAEVASKTINWTFLKKEPALDPHRIAPANSESSLTWDSGTNQWVLVSLYPMEHILVCRSKGAKLEVEEAEWGCTKVKVPKHLIDNRDLMTYAAKAHPEMLEPLSDEAKKGPSRLVISICTNVVSGPWKLQQTEYFTAYTPQFFLL